MFHSCCGDKASPHVCHAKHGELNVAADGTTVCDSYVSINQSLFSNVPRSRLKMSDNIRMFLKSSVDCTPLSLTHSKLNILRLNYSGFSVVVHNVHLMLSCCLSVHTDDQLQVCLQQRQCCFSSHTDSTV